MKSAIQERSTGRPRRSARGLAAWGLLIVSLLSLPARVWAQSDELRPYGALGSGFGTSVAVAGDVLVVTASGADEAGADLGAAFVYQATESGWRLVRKLLPPAERREISWSAGTFGRGLAIAGDSILVTEPGRWSGPGRGAGGFHVFDLESSGFAEMVVNEEPGISAGLGSSVAAGEGVVAVGASGALVNGLRAGEVRLYLPRGRRWTLAGRLIAEDPGERDDFGAAVAIDGNVVAVGAPGHGERGSVYLFEIDPRRRRWGRHRRIDGPPGSDRFGISLDLVAGRLVVGAGFLGGHRPGSVHLFEREGESWSPVGRLRAPERSVDPSFGSVLAASENVIVVGAPASDVLGPSAGAVYVYSGTGDGAPRRVAAPSIRGEDRFGSAVAVGGGRLVVGAPGSAGGQGSVHSFRLSDLTGGVEGPRFEVVLHPRNALAASVVNALARDRRGFLFVGLYAGGLAVFDGHEVRSYRHDPDDPGSLSDDGVLALLVDRKDRLWVGTENGLNRFDPQQESFRRYSLARGPADRTEPVVALHEADDGVVWTGTNGELFRYREDDDSFESVEPFRRELGERSERYVSGIGSDSRGRIWVLSKHLWQNRAFLYRVASDGSSAVSFPLAHEWGQVGPMMVDTADRLWIKAPEPVDLPDEPGEVLHPSGPPVGRSHWSFLEASDGSIWIATEVGLYRWTRGAAELHRILDRGPDAPARRWDFSHSLLEVGAGAMLVGTNVGLYGARDAIATTGGAEARGRLVLTRLFVTGESGRRRVDPERTERLELGPSDYGLEFEFADLDLFPDEERRYQVRIEGFDREWVDARGRWSFSYTSLPAGEYALAIRASTPEGETIGSLRLPLQIRPPFWRTTWFRGLMLLGLIGLVAAAYQVRKRQLIGVERLRLRIASDLHDELSTSLSAIAMMSERTASRVDPAQPARSTLERIGTLARQMVGGVRDLVWLIDPGNDGVEQLVMKMRTTAKDLLGEVVRFEVGDRTGLQRLGMGRRRDLLLIFKELVHNAARHAHAEQVTIRLSGTPERVDLLVEDDGVGFDVDEVHGGHGLSSLRVRADRIGADLDITTQPGAGTRVRVSVPTR